MRYRLWIAHTFYSKLKSTKVTFEARSKKEADSKADKFVKKAQLTSMFYKIQEEPRCEKQLTKISS